MRWQRNIDDQLVMVDKQGVQTGHVFKNGHGYHAGVWLRESRPYPRVLLGCFSGSQAAKRAVEDWHTKE